EIADRSGNVVYTNAPGSTVNGGSASFRWNGKLGPTKDSPVAPDGTYTLTVTATDTATGTSTVSSARFVLDTKPPLLLWGAGGVSPAMLTGGPLRMRFRLYDLTSVRVTMNLVDQGGRKLETGRGWPLKPGRAALRWPSTHGARLA